VSDAAVASNTVKITICVNRPLWSFGADDVDFHIASCQNVDFHIADCQNVDFHIADCQNVDKLSKMLTLLCITKTACQPRVRS
jgi:hypothetical protein